MGSTCQVSNRPSLTPLDSLLCSRLPLGHQRCVTPGGAPRFPSPETGAILEALVSPSSCGPLTCKDQPSLDRLIPHPDPTLLSTKFRGELPGRGVCESRDGAQVKPASGLHEEGRRDLPFLPFPPDRPPTPGVHTLL